MELHHQHKKYIGNEGSVLFNDALNTFYLWLSTHFIYGYMASVKKNLLSQKVISYYCEVILHHSHFVSSYKVIL